MKIERCCIE